VSRIVRQWVRRHTRCEVPDSTGQDLRYANIVRPPLLALIWGGKTGTVDGNVRIRPTLENPAGDATLGCLAGMNASVKEFAVRNSEIIRELQRRLH